MNMADKKDLSICRQVRICRPTNNLDEVLRFYCEGLGMQLLLRFNRDRWGYGGVILGGLGSDIHLEFTIHEGGFPGNAILPPSSDHLIVFYIITESVYHNLISRLEGCGYFPVAAGNPHWDKDGITFQDPDGWRVVLMKKTNV